MQALVAALRRVLVCIWLREVLPHLDAAVGRAGRRAGRRAREQAEERPCCCQKAWLPGDRERDGRSGGVAAAAAAKWGGRWSRAAAAAAPGSRPRLAASLDPATHVRCCWAPPSAAGSSGRVGAGCGSRQRQEAAHAILHTIPDSPWPRGLG